MFSIFQLPNYFAPKSFQKRKIFLDTLHTTKIVKFFSALFIVENSRIDKGEKTL